MVNGVMTNLQCECFVAVEGNGERSDMTNLQSECFVAVEGNGERSDD